MPESLALSSDQWPCSNAHAARLLPFREQALVIQARSYPVLSGDTLLRPVNTHLDPELLERRELPGLYVTP